ncbi:universal stress protein [Rhodobacteraceae bacterium N5(2021)]|uniref:Universal stress protein n=1 Tax=Gymnodinialimonas phycosphaerae TaxID=2841589 RepID=A0A975TTM9_9RHOB|nr:universal stress protein [Gymnodinialimonas phycosphaerae]MBY4893875.1 universal stress protein [Gymnodinialimonas phycosphaerae]
MALKTLLVCLIDPESAEAAMSCAVSLARAHNAHLVALHTLEALVVYPGVAIHLPPEVYARHTEAQMEQAAIIEKIFHKHTDNEDIVAEWRLLKASSTTIVDRIIESARAADVVVMPNATKAEDQNREVQARVIRESGRPVLVVPPNFTDTDVGKRIVLGWSETREATRGAHDLLNVAQSGAEISVLRVGDASADELRDHGLVDLATMYDRHGLRAQMAHVEAGSGGIAGAVLKCAFENGADMIVTGAFGHSRAYDFVFGAVTSGLLRHAEIPVLFSN